MKVTLKKQKWSICSCNNEQTSNLGEKKFLFWKPQPNDSGTGLVIKSLQDKVPPLAVHSVSQFEKKKHLLNAIYVNIVFCQCGHYLYCYMQYCQISSNTRLIRLNVTVGVFILIM